MCTQLSFAGDLEFGSEDCLTLDVYRPHGADESASLPVFAWIYGGGFVVGSARDCAATWDLMPPVAHMYDSTNIVKRHEHVAVNMNYRLSGMGFFALPELAAESNGTTGNYGTQDQRAALQWVQRNIRGFGGDPSRVTLAGESAGAFSVMWHLVSKQSRGLFHAAIMESGSSKISWFFQNQTEAFEFYSDFAAIQGCEGEGRVACLRELPPHALVVSLAQMAKDYAARALHLPLPADIPDFASPMFPAIPFAPVIDGSEEGLLDVPIRLVSRGEFAKVPLIVGSNKDGGAYFGPLSPALWGGAHWNLTKAAQWLLPDLADQQKAVELYGGPDFPGNHQRFARLMRDLAFTCSNRALATEWTKAGVPVYAYMFSFNFTGKMQEVFGDAHVFEIPFIFRNHVDTYARLSTHGKKEDYEVMQDIMSCTWASFVRCQAPRCDSDPPPHCDGLNAIAEWPLFGEERRYFSLKEEPTIETIPATSVFGEDEFPGDDRCDAVWNFNMDWHHMRPGPVKVVV